MGSRTKRVGLCLLGVLGAWAGAAGAAEDDILEQPLTPAEERRLSLAPEGGAEAVPADSWARGAFGSPLTYS